MDDQSLGDTVKDEMFGAYKKANDWVRNKLSSVPTPGYGQPSDHDKAIADVNKQLNDQRAADATKSFATQTAAQKKTAPQPTPGKIVTSKAGPRKKM
jgi:hypothetical protein